MKVKDWREGIEDSEYFFPIISSEYFEDLVCIEQALYAKSLKKPTILFVIKGTTFLIPDLFENIITTIEIEDEKDLKERKEEIINNLRRYLKNERF